MTGAGYVELLILIETKPGLLNSSLRVAKSRLFNMYCKCFRAGLSSRKLVENIGERGRNRTFNLLIKKARSIRAASAAVYLADP
jgi:hypothetical protein